MSELIVSPEYETLEMKRNQLQEQLTKLLLERDYIVYHLFNQIKADYIQKIGRFEYSVFELNCEVLRLKRKIEMIQMAINQQKPIEIDTIDKALDKELKTYIDQLEEQAKEQAFASMINKSDKLSKEESDLIKKLYRKLAKQLHPDLNPNLSVEQKSLWNRVLDAYELSDLETLKLYAELPIVGAQEVGMNTLAQLKENITFLNQKIKMIIHDIEVITSEFPYTEESRLKDKGYVEDKQKELQAQIIQLEKRKKELQSHLELLMPSSSHYIH